MASSGSFNTNAYTGVSVGNPYLEFSWSVNGSDSNNNKHTIHYKVVGKGLNAYQYCQLHRFKLVINGDTITDTQDISIAVYTDTVVVEGDKDIYHEADGSKTFSAEIIAGFYSYNSENVSGSGSWELDKFERYATISVVENSKDINSIKINWSSNATISSVKYSIDNGVNYSAYKGANAKSGTVTISELEANTIYKIKIRIKRKDNSLETTSSTLTIKTYDYAKFAILNNSNFADSIEISKNNESGLNNNLEIYINGEIILSRSNIENSYDLIFTQEELDKIYKKYGNSNTVVVKYKLITVCNDVIYTDTQEKNIVLTGNAKTSRLNINNTSKRAKVYISINGIIKEAIVWIGVNGTPKRCI